jgi:hypothetical protein
LGQDKAPAEQQPQNLTQVAELPHHVDQRLRHESIRVVPIAPPVGMLALFDEG